MLVLIEGTDFMGKTHLAKQFQERFGLGYTHLSKPDEDFDYCSGYLAMMKDHHVFDRFHLGTLVYGSDLGCYKHTFDAIKQSKVNKSLKLRNALLILMYESNEDGFRTRLAGNDRAEMYNKDQIVAANESFLSQAITMRAFAELPNVFLYDVSQGWLEFDELLDRIKLETHWRPEIESVHRLEAQIQQSCQYRHVVAVAFDEYGQRIDHANNRTREGEICGKLSDTGPCGCVHAEDWLLSRLYVGRQSARIRTIALSCSPCSKCAQLIVDNGHVEFVVYGELYERDTRGVEILNEAGIKTLQA